MDIYYYALEFNVQLQCFSPELVMVGRYLFLDNVAPVAPTHLFFLDEFKVIGFFCLYLFNISIGLEQI